MNWLTLGYKWVPLIVAAIQGVERIVKGHGKTKQDAAVELFSSLLASIEGIAEQDYLNDAEVQKALRSAINAIVEVQNVIAALKVARPS